MWSTSKTATERRRIIVFCHIFKTAGTSVRLQMQKCFGTGAVKRFDDGDLLEEKIADALGDPRLRVMCGHFKYHRIHRILNKYHDLNLCYFSFVRNPLDRLISMYNHFRRFENSQWHAQASRLDINDFLHFLYEADRGGMQNHQCAALSRQGRATFRAAWRSVKSDFEFVGVTDNIGAVNDKARALMGMAFNPGRKQNVSKSGATREALREDTKLLLDKALSDDQRLYEEVRKRVSRAESQNAAD